MRPYAACANSARQLSPRRAAVAAVNAAVDVTMSVNEGIDRQVIGLFNQQLQINRNIEVAIQHVALILNMPVPAVLSVVRKYQQLSQQAMQPPPMMQQPPVGMGAYVHVQKPSIAARVLFRVHGTSASTLTRVYSHCSA